MVIGSQQRHLRASPRSHRTGSALILVLVVIAMLSLGAYTFSRLMVVEYRAAIASGSQHAVQNWAESGVEYMAALLTADGGGWETDLYHNPAIFHVALEDGGGFTVIAPLEDPNDSAVLRMGVIDESAKINLNAIAGLAPDDGLARNLLLFLPNMTEEIADCILDWIDPDDTTREFGVETESDSIVPPRNGPLQTLEELLVIPGITPALLYGEDTNRNGILDFNENDGDRSLPYDNADGILDLGWAEFLTLYSKESNLQHNADYYGQPRLNVNEQLLTDLYDQIEERMGATEAQFITAYRLNGPVNLNPPGTDGDGSSTSGTSSSSGTGNTGSGSSGSSNSGASRSGGSGSGGSSSGSSSGSSGSNNSGSSRSGGLSQSGSGSSGSATTGNSTTDQQLLSIASDLASTLGGASGTVTRGGMDVAKGGSTQINSIYDLVGAQVNATIDGQETVLESPWKSDPGSLQQMLPMLLDTLTTRSETEIQGRININQARREVLLGIPEIPEGVPDAIISARSQRLAGSSGTADRFATAGWLLIEGLVDLETMRKLDSSITAGGNVIRVQVIGHGDQPGPMSRVEAIIDGTQLVPKIIYQRNLSDLGAGFQRGELPGFSENTTNAPHNP